MVDDKSCYDWQPFEHESDVFYTFPRNLQYVSFSEVKSWEFKLIVNQSDEDGFKFAFTNNGVFRDCSTKEF